MKKYTVLLMSMLFVSGCATTTSYPRVELQEEDFADKPRSITLNVPFEEQTPKLCGPTALYMVSKPLKTALTLKEVTDLTYSPAANGSYKQDMLAGARRLGLAPYRIRTLSEIVSALSFQEPVIIFHSTNFLWKNFWHYSVLTGYNRAQETFSMHIGPYAYRDAKISDVIGSWVEGGSWGYVVLQPNHLPLATDYQESLENALAFLRLGNHTAALELSAQILKRWPERYEADVVMAEALLKGNETKNAYLSLKRALKKEPGNLALKQKIRELSRN